MGRLKKFFTSWRIILLLLVVAFMLVAIRPTPGNEGVVIKSVAPNSTAALGGIPNPKPTAPPLTKEVITAINNRPIANIQEYYSFVSSLQPNQTIQVRTNRGLYRLVTQEAYNLIELNETEEILVQEIEDNATINRTVLRPKTLSEPTGVVEDLGLRVDNAPTTNIRKGLDLQGGTRVLLRPAEPADVDTMNTMVDSLKERLNVYGLSDIIVNVVQDRPAFLGEPNRFILVEIAGATEEEVKALLARQGKFEAKIGNVTVFKGGDDVTYVCRTAECSGIDPQRGCGRVQDGWVCGFLFTIALSPGAAQKQAAATRGLGVVSSPSGNYLSEPLRLFLDDQEVDSLNIADDLQGRAVTDIAITGSGAGISEEEAVFNTLDNMKRLQTILITGSLPVKLEIVRTDTISPLLGSQFIRNAWLAGLLALAAVVSILMIAYRRIKIALPIIITGATEIFITLGFYALFGWNLDLAAIAGLIVAVGTGVDDQIVIIEETLRGSREAVYGWKERIKRAFFIILSAYFTVVVAMLPLLFAGAGLLRGFAITTIIGVTVGVLLTRPAYAKMIQILYED